MVSDRARSAGTSYVGRRFHATRRARLRARALHAMLALCALGAAGCEMPTVPGAGPSFDPTRLTGGRLYRWPLGATVAIHVDVAGAGPRGEELLGSVRRALDGWRGAWRYAELTPVVVTSPALADVVIQFAGARPLVSLEGCSGGVEGAMIGAAGRTVFCAAGDTARTLPLATSGTAGTVKVLVAVDGSAAGPGGGSVSAAILDAVVGHELGHVFGIGGHSEDAGDLMYRAPAVTSPSGRDAATLRYVLHQPPAVFLRVPGRRGAR